MKKLRTTRANRSGRRRFLSFQSNYEFHIRICMKWPDLLTRVVRSFFIIKSDIIVFRWAKIVSLANSSKDTPNYEFTSPHLFTFPMPAFSRSVVLLFSLSLCGIGGALFAPVARAQGVRFTLRAEPDVIPANGISTTSIFVQVPDSRAAISANPIVRFATTAGTIESQTSLSGGVARVLLRSAATPGTAVVTAFIGNSREVITVEFSAEGERVERYLEVAAPYVAYGQSTGVITSSGKSVFDFGDIHVESDVRLDIDLYAERVWAQGNRNGVTIRQGRGARSKTLRGDRLFFDLQRRSGVIRRAEGDNSNANTSARQEFFGSDFASLPPLDPTQAPASITPIKPGANSNQATADAKAPAAPEATTPAAGQILGDGINNDAPQNVLDNRQAQSDALAQSGAVAAKIAEQTPATQTDTAAPTTPTDAAAPAPQTADAPVADAPVADLPGDATVAAAAETAEPAIAPENASITDESATLAGDVAGAKPKAQNSANNNSSATNANSNAPGEQRTQSNPLVTQPRPDADGTPGSLAKPAPYKPLSDDGPEPRIVELPPPAFDVGAGYWVAARRLRVFPRSEIQFERASIYFNGGKAFKAPLYVLPLDGSFNPTTDLFAFNSEGGLSVRFPVFYQASKGGTGSLILRNEPGAGFSSNRSGPSLELDQQYTLSPGSRGRFGIDEIGNGSPNFNFQHQQSLGGSSVASFFLNVPRGRDVFGRAAITKDFKALQVGLETFYDAPSNQASTTRGQFYARLRPKNLGKSGFSYTVSANLLAISRYGTMRFVPDAGGGIGIPGQGGGQNVTEYNPLYGQTLTAALQAPLYQPWRGAQFTGNLLTTAYSYSNGSRGVAPGIILGYSQSLGNRANLRLDYTYDRSSIGLYGVGGNFTNYVSASLDARVTPKIGFSTFLSQSLTDRSLYGSSDLNYRISSKWRAGLFADYSKFSFDSSFNYGWTLGRTLGPRELTINYDAIRARVYFQIGSARY